jgi:hypothetical protein
MVKYKFVKWFKNSFSLFKSPVDNALNSSKIKHQIKTQIPYSNIMIGL